MFENSRFVVDSRQVTPGCVFVAIKGEKTDGHFYANEAINKGAAYVVAEKKLQHIPEEKLITVNDTIEFLLSNAREKLKKHNPVVIGITGSNGKTTTKELLYQLLGKDRAFRNPGNLNTEIGLPLSILNEYNAEKFAILEMAMNKFGDIARLCQIAMPHVAILLNVGTAHRGIAGNQEMILRGKLQLIENMQKNGTAIVLYDKKLLDRISLKPMVTFGYKKGDYQLVDYCYIDFSTKAFYKTPREQLIFNLKSIWNAGQLTNISAVLAALDILGIDCNKNILENFTPVAGRFRVMNCNGIYVVDDTYNASIESFETAVETIKKLGKRSFAVVGSIKEQGKYSIETHRKLGEILEKLDGVVVYNVDNEIEIMNCSKKIFASNNATEISDFLKRILIPGDVVLFKASRSVQIEKVLQIYTEEIRC